MADHNIAAIHDRIDEEHFQMRLHSGAITALQRRVIELESAVRELRRLAFDGEDENPTADVGLAESVPSRGSPAAWRARKRYLQK